MLNSKLDLFEQSWLDTVFEGRNKEYGAYDLRRRDAGITVRSTILGAVIFSLLISTPLIIKKIGDRAGVNKTYNEKVVVMTLPDPPVEDINKPELPPPPPPEMKSIKDIERFVPPVVAPEDEVTDELVSQEKLKTAEAGSKTVIGDESGELVIDERPVEHEVQKKVIEDNKTYKREEVQVMADYPGGIAKFREYIVWNLSGMTFESASGEVRMGFSFVVEKDGSLTSIKITSDGGNPAAAQKAVEVIAKSQKWSPAVMNGRPVRLTFTMPIVFKISE